MGGIGGDSIGIGSSGSAKIEGHVKFEQVFDIKPYLTDEKKKEVKSMLCRLFAVIVHSGKNSHSGHYICYVRNVAKNEWWKMDDARVMRASREEVVAAEAYMLFYSVMDHPMSVDLRNKEKAHKAEIAKKEASEKAEQLQREQLQKEEKSDVHHTNDAGNAESETKETSEAGAKRKRQEPEFKSGEEWARKMTTKPKSLLHAIRTAQDCFSERIEFKPEYFRCIKDEVEAGGKLGTGPSFGVSVNDIQDDGTVDGFRHALWSMLKEILPSNEAELDEILKPKENGSSIQTTVGGGRETVEDVPKSNLIIPVVEQNETLI